MPLTTAGGRLFAPPPSMAKLSKLDHFVEFGMPEVPLHTLDDDEQCPICYIEYNGSEEYPARLHCGHVFGALCILRWAWERNIETCPICRAGLFLDRYPIQVQGQVDLNFLLPDWEDLVTLVMLLGVAMYAGVGWKEYLVAVVIAVLVKLLVKLVTDGLKRCLRWYPLSEV